MSRRPRSGSTGGARATLALVLSLVAIGAYAQTRYEGEGRVVAIDEARGAVTLMHGPIQDLMSAARTEFPIQHPALLRRARVGDVVRFSLETTQGSHGVLTLSTLDTQRTAVSGEPSTRHALGKLAPWAFVGLWAAGLAVVGGGGYGLWRALRRVREELEAAATERQEIRSDLHMVARALEQVAQTLRKGSLRDVRQRLAAAQIARGGNGREGASAGGGLRLCIVRHGETVLFRTLQARPGAPRFHVMWDRRTRERRSASGAFSPERRGTERRRLPPDTWGSLGFLLASESTASTHAESRARARA